MPSTSTASKKTRGTSRQTYEIPDMRVRSNTGHSQFFATGQSKTSPRVDRRTDTRYLDRDDDRHPRRSEEAILDDDVEQTEEDSMHQPTNLSLVDLSNLQLYEQILQLRKHGISLELRSDTICEVNRLVCAGQLPLRQNTGINIDDSSLDVHNPSHADKKSVNEALATMLSIGAKITIPAFEVESVTYCPACHDRFQSRADRDKHYNGGRVSCLHCPKNFSCMAFREDHIHKTHPVQNRNSGETAFVNNGGYVPRPEAPRPEASYYQAGVSQYP